MKFMRHAAHASGWVLAAILAHAGPAQASTFEFGTITSPSSLPMGNDGLFGAFADEFTFTVGAGQHVVFSSAFSTGFANKWSIDDMDGWLYRGPQLVEDGDAETVYLPEGFPERNVTFAPMVLGAGEYQLKVAGTEVPAYHDAHITGGYAGTVDFASVGAVPEPAGATLLLAGLATLFAVTRRRRR